MTSTGIPWTPEDDTLLKELWCSGKTATKIVDNFPGRTKNAIIGRVHRLKLERSVRNVGGHPRILGTRRQNPFKPKAPIVVPELPPIPVPEAPQVPEAGITLMELKWYHCREVINSHGAPDGLALYCGKLKSGTAFCPHHESINYVPYQRRRK